MFKFKKFFLCLVLAMLLLSSAVFATDNTVLLTAPVADEEKTTEKFQTINEDKYVYDSESFSLSDVVNGNVFASTTTKFVTNPRIGGGIISGNLFALSNDVVIESDVVYSNEKDKKGNYMISSTNSKSPSLSYAGLIAFITLLVNLNGLAVLAITVTLSSFVSFLYLPYTHEATAV